MNTEKPIQRYRCQGDHLDMISMPDGDYVLFSDHEKALAEVAVERDRLARCKEETLTVESWWAKVDEAVRKHPETPLLATVAGTAVFGEIWTISL